MPSRSDASGQGDKQRPIRYGAKETSLRHESRGNGWFLALGLIEDADERYLEQRMSRP